MRARALAGVGAEVPDHRVGRLGDAALRPGAASTARPARPTSPAIAARDRAGGVGSTTRCCSPGIALTIVGLRVQGLGGAVPPVDARRLRGRADADHRVHGGGDQGGGVRRSFLRLFDVALIDAQRRLGAARSRRWRRSRSSSATSARSGSRSLKRMLGVLVGRAGRLHARRRRRRRRGSGVQATVFYLAVYLVMNLAAFAVIVARERETGAAATTSPRSRGIGADAARCWRGR